MPDSQHTGLRCEGGWLWMLLRARSLSAVQCVHTDAGCPWSAAEGCARVDADSAARLAARVRRT
eukprot:1030488-Rhodomonas_salina.1